jgi:hypothetical protein
MTCNIRVAQKCNDRRSVSYNARPTVATPIGQQAHSIDIRSEKKCHASIGRSCTERAARDRTVLDDEKNGMQRPTTAELPFGYFRQLRPARP